MKATEIIFPQHVLDEVKELFPSWSDLHGHIKNKKINSILATLKNSYEFNATSDEVIQLFKRKKESQLLERAIAAERRREVYKEFIRISDEFNEKNSLEK